MKKVLCLLLLTGLLTFTSLSLAEENEVSIFGIKLGSSMDECFQAGMKNEGHETFEYDPNFEIYYNTNVNKKIGNIKIDCIYYFFNIQRLYCISIPFRNIENFEALKNYLTKQYGLPIKEEHKDLYQKVTLITWTKGTILIYLDFDHLNNGGGITFMDIK